MKIPALYIILACILALGAWSCGHQSSTHYHLTANETLQALREGAYKLPPAEARALLKNQNDEYVFVDLRPASEFSRGALEGAINIPTAYLLDDENLKLFSNDSKTFVLYGLDEAQANGPWMLLRQMGYSNIKLLEGGYAFQMQPDSVPYITPEKAAYEYAALMNEATMEDKEAEEATRPKVQAPVAPKPAARQIVPQKKETPKAAAAEEGC
ncbi:MAG: rhodanese-like domain-containing protein [Phaeodactylibacter sp.]|nr:rhodanese-like domain-containing protein [Phaeodactylibacter sp.]